MRPGGNEFCRSVDFRSNRYNASMQRAARDVTHTLGLDLRHDLHMNNVIVKPRLERGSFLARARIVRSHVPTQSKKHLIVTLHLSKQLPHIFENLSSNSKTKIRTKLYLPSSIISFRFYSQRLENRKIRKHLRGTLLVKNLMYR